MNYWRRQWQPTPVLLPGQSQGRRSLVGYSPWGRWESDTTERLHFTFHFHALDKAMATHSSVLAWRIRGTGEPRGLPSMGSHRVRHDWSDLAAAAAAWTIKRMLFVFIVIFHQEPRLWQIFFLFFCFSLYWWEDFFSTLTFPLKSFTLISTVKSFAMQRNMETQASNYDMNIWGVGGDNYSLLVGGNNFPSVTN